MSEDRIPLQKLCLLILLSSFALAKEITSDKQGNIWKHIHNHNEEERFDGELVFEANVHLLTSLLNSSRVIIPFPDSNEKVTFFLTETTTRIMHPKLAAKNPGFKLYFGNLLSEESKEGSTSPMTGEFSWNVEVGFHAQIFRLGKTTVYVDPVKKGRNDLYRVYLHNGKYRPKDEHRHHHGCQQTEKHTKHIAKLQSTDLRTVINTPSFSRTRDYQLAVATTGEFSAIYSNSFVNIFSAILVLVQRMTGIFKREIGVGFTLVEEQDSLICFFPCSTLRNANDEAADDAKSHIESLLSDGVDGYDIGHVLTTTGGGIAFTNGVCDSALKSKGASGFGIISTGDAFAVSIFTHEVGHQFGAFHTWNGLDGQCGIISFSSSVAIEPGSGSTIMSYGGLCGTDNVVTNLDAYFSVASLSQMQAYIESESCGVTSVASNNIPTVLAPSTFTIPMNQFFHLNAGQSSDADSDALQFTWEQIDNGEQSALGSPTGTTQPRFRSIIPFTNPGRDFGLTGDNTEILPTTVGDMHFAVTVRDHFSLGDSGLGYGTWNAAKTTITVSNMGPLVITTPNSGTTWVQDVTTLVEWNAVRTNLVEPTLRIFLSIDNGVNFPYDLGTVANNDDSEGNSVTVTTPCTGSAVNFQAIIRIQSNSGGDEAYWFAHSEPFSIAASSICSVTPTPPPTQYTGVPTVAAPSLAPISAPTTKAPTPNSIAKVELILTFPTLSYSLVIGVTSTAEDFFSSIQNVIVSFHNTTLLSSDVVIRYARRLSDFSDAGIIVDAHADFDGQTEESDARSLFTTLVESSSSTIFTVSRGWSSSYEVPIISNVTYDNITAPAGSCTATKCFFVVWEANQAGFKDEITVDSLNQVIFYWTGDETVYIMQDKDSFNSCDFANAQLVGGSDVDVKNYVWLATDEFSGTTVYFAASVSNDDFLDSSLCERGLKITVNINKLEDDSSGGGGGNDIVQIVIIVVVVLVGLSVVYFLFNCLCRSSKPTYDSRGYQNPNNTRRTQIDVEGRVSVPYYHKTYQTHRSSRPVQSFNQSLRGSRRAAGASEIDSRAGVYGDSKARSKYQTPRTPGRKPFPIVSAPGSKNATIQRTGHNSRNNTLQRPRGSSQQHKIPPLEIQMDTKFRTSRRSAQERPSIPGPMTPASTGMNYGAATWQARNSYGDHIVNPRPLAQSTRGRTITGGNSEWEHDQLPQNWSRQYTRKGKVYYYNYKTGKSTYNFPRR